MLLSGLRCHAEAQLSAHSSDRRRWSLEKYKTWKHTYFDQSQATLIAPHFIFLLGPPSTSSYRTSLQRSLLTIGLDQGRPRPDEQIYGTMDSGKRFSRLETRTPRETLSTLLLYPSTKYKAIGSSHCCRMVFWLVTLITSQPPPASLRSQIIDVLTSLQTGTSEQLSIYSHSICRMHLYVMYGL